MTVERWNDEMLDRFASSMVEASQRHDREISELRQELRQGMAEVRQELKQGIAEVRQELKQGMAEVRQELKEGMAEVRQELKQRTADLQEGMADLQERMDINVDQAQLMMLAINALTQTSIDYKRWKKETDQRFNILLEEVRAISQRVAKLES